MTRSPARVLWVRHGQSTWNVIDRFQGQTHHPPLTAKGREQARSAAAELDGLDVDRIVSSPLRRAAQTAQIIGDLIGRPVEFDGRLVEQEHDESPDDVRARARAFLSHPWAGTTVVVAHGNFIVHTAEFLTGLTIETPDNGAVVDLPLPVLADVS